MQGPLPNRPLPHARCSIDDVARRMRVELDRLSLGAQVSREGGGKAPIYEIDPVVGRAVGWSGPLVAKLYRQPLGAGALDAFTQRVSWALSLAPTSKTELYRVAAWPLLVVAERGKLAGIVMPDQRARYAAPMRLPSGGTQTVLMSLEHVLMGDEYLERRLGMQCDPVVRAAIGERLATALAILHRHSIVASDISQANVLVQIAEICAVTFIDCDSMTFRGSTVLKPLETPGWELPPQWNQSPTTRAADSYKLGLAILRLFACNQSERQLDSVKTAVPSSLHSVLEESLSDTPGARPAAGSWQIQLRLAMTKPMPRRSAASTHRAAVVSEPRLATTSSTGTPGLGQSPPTIPKAMTGGGVKPARGRVQPPSPAISARARMMKALRRDSVLVIAWSAALCLALFAASLGLTFRPAGASAGAVVAAAWGFFWPGLLAGTVSALFATALYDVVQVSRGYEPCFRGPPRWHPLIVLAAPVVSTWSVARTGSYVSPDTWAYLPVTPAIAHVGALFGRYVMSLGGAHLVRQGGAVIVAAASLAAGLLISPSYGVPSASAQLALDRSIAVRTGIGKCHHVPIEGNGGLLRDSLGGELQCQRRGYVGLFFVFRNGALLRLYASQRAAKARHANTRLVPRCQESGAAYVGSWYANGHRGTALGTLVCYQHHTRAVVEWSDSRDDMYSIVQRAGRARLYAWWHTHGVTGR